LIDYFERKLAQLRDNFNKEEFVKIYALAVREREKTSPELKEKIESLFTEFSTFLHKEEKKEVKKADYKSKNDQTQLEEGGNPSPHLFQSKPMFFRRNGMVYDAIDLYNGKAVFIVNNGPSFNGIDQAKLKQPGILTYGMNNGAHLFRPNLWGCVDDPSRFMQSIWSDPTITKFIPMSHFDKPIWDKGKDSYIRGKTVGDFPNVIGFRRNELFDADTWLQEDTINWGNHKDNGGGRSVLIATMKICYLLGFKRIYLVGCDFSMDENNKYWFDEQRTEQSIKNNNKSYGMMNDYFAQLRPKFEEVGVEVNNLTPNSKLEAFNFMDFNEAIEKETIQTIESTYGMYVKRG
jgi:hypothetical protein